MNEHDIAYNLADLLMSEPHLQAEAYDGPTATVERVEHFEEAGLLTMDKGLVVRLSDGTEFQITVKQSR